MDTRLYLVGARGAINLEDGMSGRTRTAAVTLALLFLLALPGIPRAGPEDAYTPGTFRWSIKTSVPAGADLVSAQKVRLEDLLKLEPPAGITKEDPRYLDQRIPAFPNPLGVKERDLLATTGYLQVAATETNDGDYHIQISPLPDAPEPCLIVEIPIPHAKFVADPSLYPCLEKAREFIQGLLRKPTDEPSKRGSVMRHPPHVQVTGQLFLDYFHQGTTRGKVSCKTGVLWELHPVLDIRFAPKPNP